MVSIVGIVCQIVHGAPHLMIAVVADLKSPLIEKSTQLGLVSLSLFIGAFMLTNHVLTTVSHVVHVWTCWPVGPFFLPTFAVTLVIHDTAATGSEIYDFCWVASTEGPLGLDFVTNAAGI